MTQFAIVRSFGEGRVQVSIGAFWDLFEIMFCRTTRAIKERALHHVIKHSHRAM